MQVTAKRHLFVPFLSAVLMLVVVLALGGCGGGGETDSTAPTTATTVSGPSTTEAALPSSSTSAATGPSDSVITTANTETTTTAAPGGSTTTAGDSPATTTPTTIATTTTAKLTTTTAKPTTTTAKPTTTTAKPTTTTAKPTTTTAPKAPTALTVKGPSGTKELSMADLKAMSATSGYGGWKNQLGNITGPVSYKGVSLRSLMKLVGGSGSVTVVASDGYTQSMSSSQVGGSVNTYDPTTGEPISGVSVTAIVAYQKGGSNIGSGEGPLRIGFVSSGSNQVTDSDLWVKWVVELRFN
jgi:hypothetical protein